MLIFIAFNLCVKAQTIGYTYKALAAEGCSIKYSVTKQDSVYYIIVTVRSDRLNFLKESTFWLKTFDGDIIKRYQQRGEKKYVLPLKLHVDGNVDVNETSSRMILIPILE